jgi:hypothetical protein
MTETYTIEAADDGAAIDPRLLRELRDLLRDDEDLDLGVRLKDRPAAPGEQGAIPVALEILAAAAPLSTALATVLKHWIDKNKLYIKVRRKGGPSITLSGLNLRDAERLIEKLERGSGAPPDVGA